MSLGEKINEAMLPHNIFSINLFGFKIPVTDTVIMTWIIMGIAIILAYFLTRNLKPVPKGKQNFVEMIVDSINNLVKGAVGHHWRPYAPYLGSLIIFLAIANTVSIFNIIPQIGSFAIKPPTKDINVTTCMAIMTIVLVIFSGIAIKRPKKWLHHFIEPMPVMLPFNILDYLIKPLSLCLRLFGNILAAFIIMELIYMVVPLVVPAALSIYFDLFDGLLQAYIFVFLTSLYIGEAIE